MTKTILEICASDTESIHAAANGGADRVEVCCALSEGGITPSAGMIEEALSVPDIKVNVLIRPRPGDFLFSEPELRTMLRDITFCRQLGVDGVVLGALTPEGDVDKVICGCLGYAAGGMHKTFHRAFDMCRDPRQAVRDIIDLGFDRILTSGQAPSAMEGAALIRELQQEFPEMTFIAAGGITPANAAEIVRLTGVREIHASGKSTVGSPMLYRNPVVSMGASGADEFSHQSTARDSVEAIRQALASN